MNPGTNDGKVQEASNQLALSFLAIRRGVGMVGLFTPILLLVYFAATDESMTSSISHTFHTGGREIFRHGCTSPIS